MRILLNNREEIIEVEQLTMNELIQLKRFTFRLLVTKVNDRLVKREDRDQILVKDGDKVEIMHLISGG